MMQEQENKKISNMEFTAPNAEGNVWPRQRCPAFTPRGGAPENTCWYCVYADFHLDKPRCLEVGVCYWPKKILD